MRRGLVIASFLGPTLAILLFFVIWPTVFMVYVSTLIYGTGEGTFAAARFVGADNYIRTLTDDFFLSRVLPLTAQYVGTTLVAELLLGLGLALLAASALRGARIFRTLISIPLFMAPVAAACIWGYIMDPSVGLANFILQSLGLQRLGWWGSPKDSMLSVVILDVWQWTPFIFLILLAGIMGLPREPFEAASIDGASELNQFRHITLRLLRPVIIIAALIRLLDLVKTVDPIFVMTYGGPARSTNVFTFLVFWTAFQEFQVGEGAAQSVILLIMQNIIATVFIWQFYKAVRR